MLDAAKAKGFRDGENPARWRGRLDHLLPRPSKLARGHHAAMPYNEVAAFVGDLRGREAFAALALEYCILTVARSGEILGMRWAEIDLDKKIWTVPAHRMKAGREHRVPLSQRVTAILVGLTEQRSGDFVFAGQRRDKSLSHTAMDMILRRREFENATVHGFRSSFRDWAGNETDYPRDLIETALAHVVGDKAEQAYRRSDALEKRRELMEAWASFCTARPAEKIVSFRNKASATTGSGFDMPAANRGAPLAECKFRKNLERPEPHPFGGGGLHAHRGEHMGAFDHAYWPLLVAVPWVTSRDRDVLDQGSFDKPMRYLAVALANYAVEKGFRSHHK